MKIRTIKKIEELKGQFEEFKEEIEELLADEEDYIEELADKGRVSESSENAVSCLQQIQEYFEAVAEQFVYILEE